MKELLERLRTSKPAFFAKIQIYAGIIFAAATTVVSLPSFGIAVPDNIISYAQTVIAIAISAGVVAQLPKKDSTQK